MQAVINSAAQATEDTCFVGPNGRVIYCRQAADTPVVIYTAGSVVIELHGSTHATICVGSPGFVQVKTYADAQATVMSSGQAKLELTAVVRSRITLETQTGKELAWRWCFGEAEITVRVHTDERGEPLPQALVTVLHHEDTVYRSSMQDVRR